MKKLNSNIKSSNLISLNQLKVGDIFDHSQLAIRDKRKDIGGYVDIPENGFDIKDNEGFNDVELFSPIDMNILFCIQKFSYDGYCRYVFYNINKNKFYSDSINNKSLRFTKLC